MDADVSEEHAHSICAEADRLAKRFDFKAGREIYGQLDSREREKAL
jgi:hypothetical protein